MNEPVAGADASAPPANALEQALLGEVYFKVAANRVLGDAEACDQLEASDPPVALHDPREDRLPAFSRQHFAGYSTNMPVSAGYAPRSRDE